jgi:competence protein ComEC
MVALSSPPSRRRSCIRNGGSVVCLSVLAAVACAKRPGESAAAAMASRAGAATDSGAPPGLCGGGKKLAVHFYDVGQGLAALVDLPDGRHLLVDTGDNPGRAGCGMCAVEHEHLVRRLSIDLREAPIDVLWITHAHSDHLGGAPEVLASFKVGAYVDNGLDERRPEVRRAHEAAQQHGVPIRVVDPEHRRAPLVDTPELRFRAVLPAVWPLDCDHDPNECSLGLRVDFCSSSVLFVGDAEREEEAVLDPGGPVTLLQVAHHGSETSTSPDFLAQAKPKYAVISAGKRADGPGREECHPHRVVVERLTQALGGAPAEPLESFDGERCDRAKAPNWVSVPTTDRLWATERDGDVVLSTTGDGTFVRVSQ